MKSRICHFSLLITLVSLALSACVALPLPSEPASDPIESAVDTLGNLTYDGILPDQPLTLIDGVAFYEEDGPGTPFLRMSEELVVLGDLDMDGGEDALLFLVDHTTGSGNFVYLVAVKNVWTDPTPTTPLMIGDRTPVKSLAIEDGQVVAELIAHGAGDPACCPSWNVRKTFQLGDGGLVEKSSDEMSKVSLDDLTGTSWRLVDINLEQESVLLGAAPTLQIEEGQISGSAGCNNYSASVTGDADLLQTFVVGPIAATGKLCDEAISQQETTYLDRLAKVASWRYDFGYLSLLHPLDGEAGFGELRFVPQPSVGAPEASAPTSSWTRQRPWTLFARSRIGRPV